MLTRILNLLTGEGRGIQNPNVPISSKEVSKYLAKQGAKTRSGESVGVREAISCSPVWQALDLITSDVSRMPWVTYRHVELHGGEGKERAREHSVYRLLRKHTGEMTSNLFVCRMLGNALLYGNGYARIHFRGLRPVKLEWLHADRVTPIRKGGDLDGLNYEVIYKKELHGREAIDVVDDSEMFHLVGLTLDELGGLSLVEYARNAIGRQLATEHYTDDMFANLGQPSGFFTHPEQLSEEAQKNFLAAFEARHNPNGKRFRAGILEEGMSWEAVGITPHDALLVDQLKWGVKDVARFFNVPPHKLGEEAEGYNTTEQENRSYFNSSLGKWVSRLEWEANYKLFDDDEHFTEFVQEALFKADTKDRFEAYAIAITNGIMNRNEARARENLNPYEGGNEFLTPLNMSAGEDGASEDATPPDQDPAEGDDRSGLADVFTRRDKLVDDLEWCARLLTNSATRAAKKPAQFVPQLQSVFQKHSHTIAERVGANAAEELLRIAEEKLLAAAECQPEDLAERVSGVKLRDCCRNIATQQLTCKGIQ